MRYQVGRACAVAGYVHLYRELDLLPDASIAEEARESKRGGGGSCQIFEDFMATPTRYNVMDDYNSTLQLARLGPVLCSMPTLQSVQVSRHASISRELRVIGVL